MDKLVRVHFNQVKFGVYIYILHIYIAVNVVHNYFTQYMSTITWTTELDLRNNDNKDDDYDDDDDDNAADDDDDDDDNDNKCSVKYMLRIFCLWYVTCVFKVDIMHILHNLYH